MKMVKEERKTLSIIIPCYNEEAGIPNLHAQLSPILEQLQRRYAVQLVLVDDGSKDKTHQLLQQYFGQVRDAVIVKHEQNKNLGGAIKTGIKNSSGELVTMLDSDCTYHPQRLVEMLQLMEQDASVDVVTVSPLHPEGKIIGVPVHRLLPSKSISGVYGLVLGSKLYTHTAMVRLYKRKVLDSIVIDSDNFLAVTELLAKAILQKYKVKELPCTLEVRKYGQSKIKFAKEAKNHLGLVMKLALHRAGIRRFLVDRPDPGIKP